MYSLSSAREPNRENIAGGAEKAQAKSRSIDSLDLFGGAETLLIQHRGVTYTLRKTRSGKLILNK